MSKESKIPAKRPVGYMATAAFCLLLAIGFSYLFAWVDHLGRAIWWVDPTLVTIFVGASISILGVITSVALAIENWEADE